MTEQTNGYTVPTCTKKALDHLWEIDALTLGIQTLCGERLYMMREALRKAIDALKCPGETEKALADAIADRDWLAGQLGDCAAIEVTQKNGKHLHKTMDKQWWLDAAVRARITLPEPAKRSEAPCQE